MTRSHTARPTKVISVVGARPNFMKVAPIVRAMDNKSGTFESVLVHTGQHYDQSMSGSFFDDLGIPEPDVNLGIGGGTHAEQTGRVMMAFEHLLLEQPPEIVLVVGDVNSTLACALAAKKLNIRVGHVEAGLRSGDMTMPEEINRLCTDAIADYLFTTDRLANANLVREGIAEERIHFVGNVMIDTLLRHLPSARTLGMPGRMGLSPRSYATLTMHRPSNVDDPDRLADLLEAILDTTDDLPVVFPIHPRSRQRITSFGLDHLISGTAANGGLIAVDPLGYLEFLGLNADARLVVTDSGGLQEETTVLGVPCVTVRDNTERPITIEEGTNILASTNPDRVRISIKEALGRDPSKARHPEKWDGMAAERIADVIANMEIH